MRKLVLLSLGLVLAAATSALAGPDTYSGDAAIYSAVPNDTNRPNILFLIDTSKATENIASGQPYDNSTTYTGTYTGNAIYFINQQGTGWNLLSSTLTLSGVTCMGEKTVTDAYGVETTLTVDINNTLSQNGTYTGAGNDWYPNIANDGSCLTAPNGDTFAVGNYLNYLSQNVVSDAPKVWSYYTQGNNQRIGIFQLVETHTADETLTKPAEGSDWELYWVMTDRNVSAADVSGIDQWVVGSLYEMTTTLDQNPTQREIFYQAMATVIRGARGEVNFGAYIYGQTQGGKLVAHMADLRETADLNPFLDKLPQSQRTYDTDGNLIDVEPIPSGTEPLTNVNRPLAEALFDTGIYYNSTIVGYTDPVNTTAGASGKITDDEVPADIPNPCGYDHIIVLTNGLPNGDGGSLKVRAVGDYDGDNYPDEATYGDGSHYLDDLAYYLNTEEGITVHTVLAFQAADELISDAAQDGGGEHYVAQNANDLQEALQNMVRTIVAEKDTSFVAPVVPASSTNRTISSNRVYLGLFKPQIKGNWHGNLKKYGIDTSNRLLDANGDYATDTNGDFIESSVSYWSDQSGVIPSASGDKTLSEGDGGVVDAGGAGGALLKQSSRNIYTYLTSSNSGVSSANVALSNSQNNLDLYNSDVLYNTTLEVTDQADRNRLLLYLEGLATYRAEYDTINWSTIHDNTTASNDTIDSIAQRPWVMGDVLHSKPLVFNYSPYGESLEGVCESDVASGDPHNSSIVFVGANDGMLHAINDCDGTERWAFVPPLLLNDLQHLSESGHVPFVDSPPTAYVHDTDNDGTIESGDGDRVVLLFGLRRGGGSNYALSATDADDERLRGAYYALDVTDPDSPEMLWEITSDTDSHAFEELGEAWSQPRLAKIRVGSAKVIAAFFGAGYDVNDNVRYGASQLYPASTDDTTDLAELTDDAGFDSSGAPKHSSLTYNSTSSAPAGQHNPRGRGLYAVEVARLTDPDADGNLTPNFDYTGDKLWGATHGSLSNSTTSHTHPKMWWPIPGDLTVIDQDSDGFSDTIYAGDTGGAMWRFSIGDSNRSNWKANVIFYASQYEGGRRFYYKPAVAIIEGNPWLFFGSGDRAHPLNMGVVDEMYALIDRGQYYVNPNDGGGTKITTDHLEDVTDNLLQNSTDLGVVQDLEGRLDAETNYGWYITLSESGHTGEKVLAPPTVYNGEVFYSTYTPDDPSTLDDCDVGNLGTSRLYHLDYKTGEAVFNYDDSNDEDDVGANERALSEEDNVLKRSDRVRTLGEGIPSGIVTLIDASGHVTMMISSSNKVDTQTAPDSRLITPVYWMQW